MKRIDDEFNISSAECTPSFAFSFFVQPLAVTQTHTRNMTRTISPRHLPHGATHTFIVASRGKHIAETAKTRRTIAKMMIIMCNNMQMRQVCASVDDMMMAHLRHSLPDSWRGMERGWLVSDMYTIESVWLFGCV